MTEPNRELSVVLFSYRDASNRLKSAIFSILGQEQIPVTLYIVNMNDGSDGYTLSLQDDILNLRDVFLFTPKRTDSVGAIRRQLLHRITTPYVAFAHATDLWERNKALTQITLLEKYPEAFACCCGYEKRSHAESAAGSSFLPPETQACAQWLLAGAVSSTAFVYRTQMLQCGSGFCDAMDISQLDRAYCLDRLSSGECIAVSCEKLFCQYGTSPLITAQGTYRGAKMLYDIHYDLFLRNKRALFQYDLCLAKLAAGCNEWVLMVIHVAMACLRMPRYALQWIVSRGAKAALHFIRHAIDELRFHHCLRTFRKTLQAMRQPEYSFSPAPAPLPASASPEGVQTAPAIRPFLFAFRQTASQVILPDDITAIPRGLFAGNRALESIRIPASVQRIEPGAFFGCCNLRSVTFSPGSTLSAIGSCAFAGCSALEGITLPATVNALGSYAFAGCECISRFRFANAKGIDDAFPAMITQLPEGIFAGCRSLQRIIFPEASLLSSIGADAFLGCGNLSVAQFQSVVSSIGQYAFAQCQRFEHLIMPHMDAIETIGRGCFLNCRQLNYFRVPYALTQIQPLCFYGCSELRNVKLNRNLQIIGSRAFSGCGQLLSVNMRKSVNCAADAFDPDTQINTN